MKTKLYGDTSRIAVDLSMIVTIVEDDGVTRLFAAGEDVDEGTDVPAPFDEVYADWLKAKGEVPT